MCTFLGEGFPCFHTFYLLGAHSALNLSVEGGGGAAIDAIEPPTFGPGDGREELDKIVCRNSSKYIGCMRV